ncbi:MAG TPA: hypothetical protein VMX17_13580 [Candidatus Glassbacteria bacterium]|nr:hypothetical protein [Candidatus Glassbacteria bacterium]
MDEDGYPEDDEIEKVMNWHYEDGFNLLMDYVEQLWHWPDWGFIRIDSENFELHTGGWSGNEEIIYALQHNRNFFWIFCWVESKRGGHYKFEIKQKSIIKEKQNASNE